MATFVLLNFRVLASFHAIWFRTPPDFYTTNLFCHPCQLLCNSLLGSGIHMWAAAGFGSTQLISLLMCAIYCTDNRSRQCMSLDRLLFNILINQLITFGITILILFAFSHRRESHIVSS